MAYRFLELDPAANPDVGDSSSRLLPMEQLIPEDHEFLIHFLDYDFSSAENLLREYLSCLSAGKEPKKQLLPVIIREIQQSHPFFLFFPNSAPWLLNRIFAGQIHALSAEKEEAEQRALLRKICIAEDLLLSDSALLLSRAIGAGDRYVLESLMDLQHSLRFWVFLALDNTNPALAALSGKERNALYSQMMFRINRNPLLDIRISYSMAPSAQLRESLADWTPGNKERVLGVYRDLTEWMEHPDRAMPSDIQALADAVSETREDCNLIIYHLRDFSNLLNLEMFEMTHSGLRLKRCKNCGRYFVLEKSNQEYCSRLAPGSSRLCSQVGRMQVYGRRMTADTSPAGLYRKAYKTHFARFARGLMSESDFNVWKQQAQQKRDQALSGALDPVEFETWLKL